MAVTLISQWVLSSWFFGIAGFVWLFAAVAWLLRQNRGP